MDLNIRVILGGNFFTLYRHTDFISSSKRGHSLSQFSHSVVVNSLQFHGVQELASLPITNSQGLLKLTSIESVMPSNHLILCHPVLLLPSIFPSIQVFSNESVLHIRWPKVLEFQLQHQSFKWTFRTDFL